VVTEHEAVLSKDEVVGPDSADGAPKGEVVVPEVLP
jgi:hypothetical protein